jgi:protein involved in polysaccharide export with SLBB domain
VIANHPDRGFLLRLCTPGRSAALRAPLRRLLRALPLLALLCVAAPAAAQDAVLSPGDLVKVTVYRNPDLSGEMEVGQDGTLMHPLYRGLRVAGLTSAQLDEALLAHLRRYDAQPAFVAEALVRVTVSGEVRQPQVATVPPVTTVFEAVARAGGVSATGRPNRAVLVRAGESRPVDLTLPTSPGASERVRSGDLIVVERRSTWVRDVLTPAASVTSVAIALLNLLSR